MTALCSRARRTDLDEAIHQLNMVLQWHLTALCTRARRTKLDGVIRQFTHQLEYARLHCTVGLDAQLLKGAHMALEEQCIEQMALMCIVQWVRRTNLDGITYQLTVN